MVIHVDAEAPKEVSSRKATDLENSSKYSLINDVSQDVIMYKENESFSEHEKSKKKLPFKSDPPLLSSSEEHSHSNHVTEVSRSDIEELRNVYNQCKAVMKKLESKYGQLLNINSDIEPSESQRKKRKRKESVEQNVECKCTIKKIIFDEEGQQSIFESPLGNHVCPARSKKSNDAEKQNIQIEYADNELALPNDLQTLRSILQNQSIETTYRNKIIDKMRLMKQEYVNELKFNKLELIEKLKSDPEELLDFKGTNLQSLKGYVQSSH